MSSILSHIKKKIFGNNGGLSHDELAEMTRRNRFSTYLPYTAYDKVGKRYVNNDDTYGMLWECSPVSFAGEKSYNTLQGIFRAGLPDGSIVQFVPCEQRAWHAGASRWRGRERCNDFSIGIELEGCDALPFEPVQYDVLAQLAGRIMRRYPISDVVGHADVAPGRKTDPGPHFDWTRLRALLAAQHG